MKSFEKRKPENAKFSVLFYIILINISTKMSYWIIPPFGYCLMMPMPTMESIPPSNEPDNLAKVSEENINASNSIKLNISS